MGSPSQSFSLASRSADAILRASLYADSANQAPIAALGRSFSTKKKREKKSGVVVLVLGRASGSLIFCFVSMWLKPSQVTSKSFKITHSENLNQETICGSTSRVAATRRYFHLFRWKRTKLFADLKTQFNIEKKRRKKKKKKKNRPSWLRAVFLLRKTII